MKRIIYNNGFTLIELMVTVSIIALLSAVAIPQFQKYISKSKQSEAKIQLAQVYLAQSTFYMEYDSYAACLDTMGYSPLDQESTRYYAIGFKGAMSGTLNKINLNVVSNSNAPSTCANTVQQCGILATGKTKNCHVYGAGKIIKPMPVPIFNVHDAPTHPHILTENQFRLGASAFLNSAAASILTPDLWTIDNNKKIINTSPSY